MPCPDDNALVAFAEARLSADPPSSVAAHLDDCARCRKTVAALVLAEAPDDEAFDALRSLGRYRVLARVGAGAMGVVYAAYDPELERKVAVKLLHGGRVHGDELRARLKREAQAMARLRHPNVVAVHDVGTVGDQLFIAMEFVAGVTLSRWLAEKPRSLDDIVAVFVAAGRGLAAAHQAGLVHRDFKPDNVLIGHDGSVCITDFGLARLAEVVPDLTVERDSSAPLDETLTRTGMLLGTPAYMAPEQLAGEPVDARVDQFSFGVALYEAVYAQRPFVAATLEGLRDKLMAGAIDAPPANKTVPRWLRRAVVRALARRPEDRYPSMDALLATLSRDRRALRRRLALGVASVALVALALSFARRPVCAGAERELRGTWNDATRRAIHQSFANTHAPYFEDAYRSVERSLDAYARGWVAMRTESCEATHVRGQQSAELLDLRTSCLDRRRDELGGLVELFSRANAELMAQVAESAGKLSDLAACSDTQSLLARQLPPRDEATRTALTQLHRELAHIKAAIDAARYAELSPRLDRAVERARKLGHPPATAYALYLRGLVELSRATPPSVEKTFQEASWEAEAGRDEPLRYSIQLQLLAVLGSGESRPDDVARVENEARALWRRLGSDATREAEMLAAFYRAEKGLGRNEAAYEYAARALELRKAGADKLKLAAALRDLGEANTALGRDDRALPLLEQARASAEQALGSDQPALWVYWNLVGNALNRLGRYAEAEQMFRRALAIAERAIGPVSLPSATLHNSLGQALRRQLKLDAALAEYKTANDLATQLYGPEARQVVPSLSNMSLTYATLGKYPQGIECAQRALTIMRKVVGTTHPDVAITLQGLAILEIDSHRYTEALGHLDEAISICEHSQDPDSSRLAELWSKKGQALVESGKPDGAIVALERAAALFQTSGNPTDRVYTNFDLARALWLAGHDRPRARRLAEDARKEAVQAMLTPDDIAELDDWLNTHRVH